MNINESIKYADAILQAGGYPFVPHLSAFWHLANGAKQTYQTWMHYDYAWIDMCDAIVIIPGKSHGVSLEIEYCKTHNIPIFYKLEDCLDWILSSKGGSK